MRLGAVLVRLNGSGSAQRARLASATQAQQVRVRHNARHRDGEGDECDSRTGHLRKPAKASVEVRSDKERPEGEHSSAEDACAEVRPAIVMTQSPADIDQVDFSGRLVARELTPSQRLLALVTHLANTVLEGLAQTNEHQHDTQRGKDDDRRTARKQNHRLNGLLRKSGLHLFPFL